MVSSSKIDNVLILENKFEKIEINLQLGLFSIFNFEINSYIIKNATTGVVFKTKKEDEESSEETSEKEVFLSLTDRQKKIFETEDIQDEIGKGIKATIRLFNVEHQTILALEIYLYDDTPGIQIQASLTNKFGIKSIYDIYPLLILSSSNQGCIEFGDIEKWRLFKIGYQSWSNTRIMTPFDDDSLPYISWAKLPHHINYFEKRNYGQIRSNYFTVIKNIESNYNILIGYLSHKDQFTQFIYDFDPITKTFVSFKARSQADGINIEDEETIKSERLFIIISNDEIKNLNTYVKFTSKISEALTWHEIPKGYCTWYNYFQNITEDDCVKNLLQIKSHKSSIPINFFQLDDGYQIICGDWPEPPNKKFPHGMKWLVEKIKDAGLKPGLWIAPFLISPLSKLYKEHPDWVVRNEKNKPINGGWNPNLYGGSTSSWKFFKGIFSSLYVLDTTHPEVQDWLYRLFTKITKEWGFQYIKIDFVYAAAVNGKRYEKVTRAQAYRKGIQIIRDAVGDDVFLLGCGAPLGPSIGLVNGMRVSCDTAPVWDPLYAKLARKILNLPSNPSLLAAMANTILLSFLHNNWWINDPDCLMIREKESKLTLNEVKTQITTIGLSNGIYMISDNLTKIDAARLRLIKKFIPVDKVSAIPIQIFKPQIVRQKITLPRIYDRVVQTDFDSWHITGIFNWEDIPNGGFKLKFSDINLDPNKKYHIFEFWSEKYLGIYENEIDLPPMDKHSCLLLRICEVKDKPQIIGSTFHFLQGKAEIKKFEFNEENLIMSLDLEFPGYNEEKFFIYTPTRLYPYGSESEAINCNCEIIKAEPQYMIMKVEFTDKARLIINLSKKNNITE